MRHAPPALSQAAGLAILLLGLAAAAAGPQLAAQEAGLLELTDPRAERELGPLAEMLFDADPALGIVDVARPASALPFKRVGESQIYVSPAHPVAWLRFRPAAIGAGRAAQWILEVQPSFSIILDSVELYLPREGGGYATAAKGARLRRGPGELNSRYFAFELPASALSGEYCYLRLQSSMAVDVKLAVWPAAALGLRETRYAASFGLVYGVLVAMLLYNLFLSLSLRDRAYLYFVLYLLSGILWQFWVQGHAKFFLGPRPGWDLPLMWASVGGSTLWAGLFSLRFLSIGRDRPLLFWPLAASMLLSAATIAAGLAGASATAFKLSHFAGIVVPVLTIGAGAIRLARGYAPAKYYLVGWTFLAVGALAFALMGVEVIGISFWSVNGVAIGMACQSILLSMALGDRVRRLRVEKEKLQRSEARYLELSLTDPLTGLFNKRYFSSKLESEAEHAHRIGRPLALVFLDLDDFKAINDQRGHPFGDAVLVDLAAALRESTRDDDIACRYGGEEFAILMPGAGIEEAAQAAQRLRARVAAEALPRAERRPTRVTMSLGVAQLEPGEGPERLVERADAAMYAAKRGGKNRVERAG